MRKLDRSSIWTAYNAAQSEEKSRFVALLADLCSTVEQPEQGKGQTPAPALRHAVRCRLQGLRWLFCSQIHQ